MATKIHSVHGKERRSARRDQRRELEDKNRKHSVPSSLPTRRAHRSRSRRISIWSSALFGDPTGVYIREFLARVFRVKAVAAVEIRRAESFGRIYYGSTTNAQEIWSQLSDVLGRTDGITPALEPPVGQYADPKLVGVDSLYLDGPPALPIWVNRVGAALTTWRVRFQNDSRVRFTHPTLLNRGDVAHRVEEELATILGVEEYRTSTLTSSVAVRFNPRVLTVERLVCRLEKSWPRLLEGLDGSTLRQKVSHCRRAVRARLHRTVLGTSRQTFGAVGGSSVRPSQCRKRRQAIDSVAGWSPRALLGRIDVYTCEPYAVFLCADGCADATLATFGSSRP